MPLKPYEEFAQEPLTFPIGGKLYITPPLGFLDGLRLQRVIAGEDHSLDDKPAEEVWRLILGPTWDEMVADNVPLEAMNRAGMAALADFQFGRTIAETVWESGVDPEALAAAATAAASKDSKPSPSTDAASSTRSPASSSPTTSLKATKRTSRAKAKSPSRS
jgi:hypothetical protein